MCYGSLRSLRSLRFSLTIAVLLCFSTKASSAPFIRGDTDGNGQIELTDATRILELLFVADAANIDCDDSADATAPGPDLPLQTDGSERFGGGPATIP